MKHSLVTFIIVLMAHSIAHGQSNTFPLSGNVGIRNTNPIGALHVNSVRPILFNSNGGSGVYGSEIGFNSMLNTSVVPNKFIKLGGTVQKGGANLAVDYWGNMLIQTHFGDTENADTINYLPQFKFTNTGRLGIGTLDPKNELDVNGSLSVHNSNGDFGINLHSGAYTVGSGVRELFRVDQKSLTTGGIFTISATRGNFVHTSQWAWSSSHNATGRGVLTQLSAGDYLNITVYLDVQSNGGVIVSADWGSSQAYNISIQKMIGNKIDVSQAGSDWSIVSTGFTRSKIITTIKSGLQSYNATFNGNVGIGTTVIPNDFKLAVGGKILAEKIVVRKEENWNWPDFVFAKDYNLPDLLDVEEFINTNSHLPEIPSAKEIEKNGQDLAEMNRLLLKKVEELTLYMIEMKKEIITLKIKQ